MKRLISTIAFVVVGIVAGTAIGVFGKPTLDRWRGVAETTPAKHAEEPAEAGHEGHDHAGHDAGNSIELSKQAQANIGLKIGNVTLTSYDRTIAIPGMMRERPGRSTVEITAPLTGIVTQIYPIEGEAIMPGQKLFDLRLTHEELVQAQGDLLRVAEELDVVNREITRLEKIAADGGIPGRQVLERQYEQQNKQAVLRAQQQALLVHGLNAEQVSNILSKRTLLQDLTVTVPPEPPSSSNQQVAPKNYEIQLLKVSRGQTVNAGETLAVLTDHSELFIEGSAFDKDVSSVNRAVEKGWPVRAVVESEDSHPQIIDGLKILYVSGVVDPESRTFRFFAQLPNELIRNVTGADGHRFLSWRYKPGQRVQLTVPVERWDGRIVLPVGAVAQDGIETFVFSPNGDHFDRRPVHVEFRDRFSVVIANDGSVFPGDSVVLAGAQQMQLALKNKAGGGIDPHAGHNH